MQEASVLAGLAISLTQTAIAHSISYPLTSVYGVPHGLACSFTLPALIEFFLASQSEGAVKAIMESASDVLKKLNPAAGVLEHVDLPQMLALVDKMFHPERAANFALPINREDVIEILRQSV
jgi:alcohol dehydrogenase